MYTSIYGKIFFPVVLLHGRRKFSTFCPFFSILLDNFCSFFSRFCASRCGHVGVDAGPNHFLLIPMQLGADTCDYNVGGARTDETRRDIAHDEEDVLRLEGQDVLRLEGIKKSQNV